jgi:hypothetical protein
MQNEEKIINPKNVRQWIEDNYSTLSEKEHTFLGAQQVDAAYRQVQNYVDRINDGLLFHREGSGSLWRCIQDVEVEVSLVKPK